MGCVYYCEHYTHISLNTGFAFWRNVGNYLANCSPWGGKGCEDRVDIIARPAGSASKVSSRARATHFASNPLQTSLEALFFGVALFLLYNVRCGIAPWYTTSVFNEALSLGRALALERALTLGRALTLKRALRLGGRWRLKGRYRLRGRCAWEGADAWEGA